MSVRRGTWARIRHWMQRSLHGWMTCEEFEATLVDYLDGLLAPRVRRQVDLHIRLCPHCRRYLRAYDRTRRLAAAALRQEEEPALQAVPEDLVQAILAARRAEAADRPG